MKFFVELLLQVVFEGDRLPGPIHVGLQSVGVYPGAGDLGIGRGLGLDLIFLDHAQGGGEIHVIFEEALSCQVRIEIFKSFDIHTSIQEIYHRVSIIESSTQ